MAEYIKRDAALNALCKVSAPTPDESHIVEKCIEKVNRLPMMKLVKCKNCKHWNKKNSIFSGCRCENHKGIWDYTKADDFCSYGERRTDDVLL